MRLLLLLLVASSAWAQEASLRLGGKEISLPLETQAKVAALARDMFSRCGPNTLQHVGNFGPAVMTTEKRFAAVDGTSRLHVRFAEPFVTTSHLGGTLGVSEAVIGL